MISRHWRALARTGEADHYIKHLTDETFPKLSGLPGFICASILRRELATGTEFVIVTEWESLDAISGYAGDDPEAAVVPAVVQATMLEYDPRVRHYEVSKVHER
ncbi:MAG TPA: antibiotic biosynthesis monooxygenase [Gammaproteobacteria bacterium]|nr:antibiotic biosynthesis monooxygenase [Gammaproteobacteria bacterium]